MNSTKQREDLVYLIYSPTGSGVIEAVDSWGEGEVKNRESAESTTEAGCCQGRYRFLGMVMYDNEFETKENKI